MTEPHPIKLTRNCKAILIPSGEPVELAAGTEVMITQALGGTFTVTTDQGAMVRISGNDSDALGKKGIPTDAGMRPMSAGKPIGELVWDQLKTCYDPEIATNIVDLGLVYECKVTPTPENQNEYQVAVKMTLTAPGCGMGASIAADAREKIAHLPGIKHVSVDVVWDPPWNPTMMSEEARQKLGLI